MSNVYERIAQDMLERQGRVAPEKTSIYEQMSADKMSRISSNVEIKQQQSAISAYEKKRSQDPSYREFNPDEWEKDPIDGDTLRHKTEIGADGRLLTMRFALPEGHSYDAFEILKRDSEGNITQDTYGQDATRARYHREALAKQLGKDVEDISNDDLYEAGVVQRQRLKDSMESLRGQPYHIETGEDKFGRGLGRFENTNAFDQVSGGIQAGYYSPFNASRRFSDIQEEGIEHRPEARSFARTWTGDLLTSIGVGAARAIEGLTYAATIAQGIKTGQAIPKEINQTFASTRELIDKTNRFLSSDDKNFREVMGQKADAFIMEPLHKARKEEFEKAGLPDWLAWTFATGAEYGDQIEYLWENPGRIIDGSAESAVYTLGIGAIGKATAKAADIALKRPILAKLKAATDPVAARAIAKAELKAASKKVDSIVKGTAVTTVGVTEAAMNAAGAYGQIVMMTPEQLADSEEYQKLIKRGIDHEQAKHILAKKAYSKVFSINFAMAAAASYFTGAGNWEANILHSFTQSQKRGIRAQLKKASKEGLLAGSREFAEESIQSGGGEFLTQVELSETTGKPIGPGIGRATAEGGVIGLGTGATISQMKYVAEAAGFGAKKGAEAIKKVGRTQLDAAHEVTIQMGDYKKAQANVRENEDENGIYQGAEESVLEYLDAADSAGDQTTARIMPELWVYQAALRKKFSAIAKPSPAERKAFQAIEERISHYEDQYKIAVKQKADLMVQDFTDEEIAADPVKKAFLKMAQAHTSFKHTSDNEDLGDYLSSARMVDEEVDRAVHIISESQQSDRSTGKTQDQVAEEKMGHGSHQVGDQTFYGLQAIKTMATDAINTQDEEAYRKADFQLWRFINTQTQKYNAYRQLYRKMTARTKSQLPGDIEDEVNANSAWSGTVYWQPSGEQRSGTPLMMTEMQRELAQMIKVRKAIGEHAKKAGMSDSQTAKQAVNTPSPEFVEVTIESEKETRRIVEEEAQAEAAAEATAEADIEASEGAQTLASGQPSEAEQSVSEDESAPEPVRAEAADSSEVGTTRQPVLSRDRLITAGINIGAGTVEELEAMSDEELQKTVDEQSAENKAELERRKAEGKPLGRTEPDRPAMEIHKKLLEELEDKSSAALQRMIANREARLDEADPGLRSLMQGEIRILEGQLAKLTEIEEAEEQLPVVEAEEQSEFEKKTQARTFVDAFGNTFNIFFHSARFKDDDSYRGARVAKDKKTGQVTGLYFDEARIRKSYKDKPWRKPAIDGVKALPDIFPTEDSWVEFVFEHETQHTLLYRNDGESIGDYENRINLAALAALNPEDMQEAVAEITDPVPVESAENNVEESAKAALRAAGFIFVDRDDAPDIEMIRRVASKRLREDSPEDTAAALAYIVYGEMGLASRDTQMLANLTAAIEDWIRTGKTPDQVSKTVWAQVLEVLDRLVAFFKSDRYAAMEKRLEQELQRVLEDPNSFAFAPSEGRSKLNFQLLIDNNPGVAHILTIFQKAGIVAHLTGSMAYVNQTAIYRNADKPVHDVDLLYYTEEDVTRSLQLLEEEFGQGQKMYGFKPKGDASTKEVLGYVYPSEVGHQIINYKSGFTKKGGAWRSWRVVDENGKEVGTFKMVPQSDGTMKDVSTGHPGIAVDFMLLNEDIRTPVSQTYTDPNSGEKITIGVSSFIDGFVAKLMMLRAKDIKDLIAATPQANEVEVVKQEPVQEDKAPLQFDEEDQGPSEIPEGFEEIQDEQGDTFEPEVPSEGTQEPLTAKELDPYRSLYERVKDILESGLTTEEDIFFDEAGLRNDPNDMWNYHLSLTLDENGDVNIAAAAQSMMDALVEAYGTTITEASIDHAEEAQEEALTKATTTLALKNEQKRLLEPVPKTKVEAAVDFISDNMAKAMGPLVGRFSNPDNWTAKTLETVKTQLSARFKKLKLPTQILKAIKPANDQVTSLLLGTEKFFNTIKHSATKANWYKEINASVKEQQGFNAIAKFVDEFVVELNNLHLGMIDDKEDKNSVLRRSNLGEDQVALTNNLKEYVFQFLIDEQGNLDQDLAAIMALEMANWMAGVAAGTLNNDDRTINSFIGAHSEAAISPADRAKYGNGTHLTQVAQSLGRAFMKQSNMQTLPSDDIAGDFNDRAALSVGLMMTSVAASIGLVQISPVAFTEIVDEDEIWVSDVATEQADVEKEEGDNTALFIYSAPEDVTGEEYPGSEYIESEANLELRADYNAAQRILKEFFNVNYQGRGPLEEAPEAPSRIKRGLAFVPKVFQKYLKSASANGFSPSANMLNDFDRWTSPENFRKEIMGQVGQTELDTTIHVDDAVSIHSQNARNKRSYEYVTARLRDFGNQTMYFAYNAISSHRAMIDSSEINPQADKLHRVMFVMKEWEVLMTSTSYNPKTVAGQHRLLMLKLAVALAFDIKVDSEYLERTGGVDGVVELLEDKLANPVIRAGLEVMKLKQDELTDGKYTLEQEQTIGAAITAANPDEREHAWAGLKTWADFERANEDGKRTVRLTLPMEADGKTNGFASLLMQIVPNDPALIEDLMPLYSAVGIYFKKSAFKNFPEFKKHGGKDNYEGTTESAKEYVQRVVNGNNPATLQRDIRVTTLAQRRVLAEERERVRADSWFPGIWDNYYSMVARIELQNKRVQTQHTALIKAAGFMDLTRSFAKGPLTQVAYAAGMVGIRKGVKAKAIANFYEELAKAGHDMIVEEMTEQEQMEITAAAIADVLHRYHTIADVVFNSRLASNEQDQRKITQSADAIAESLLREFDSLDELILHRRSLSVKKSEYRYKLDPTEIEDFAIGIDLVYGHALQAALEDKLEHIKAFTDQMNDAVYMINLVFTEKFKDLIARHKEANGGVDVVDSERRAILNQMIRDGLVPMIKTPLSETQMDGLELTNMGQVTLKDTPKARAYYKTLVRDKDGNPVPNPNYQKKIDGKEHPTFNQEFEHEGRPIQRIGFDEEGVSYPPGLSDSTTARVKAIEPNMDIGVAAIAKAIHSSDGAVNGELMGEFPILNLFDAHYGNFETLHKATEASNEKFYTTHKDWNLGQEVSDSLHRFILLLDPSDSRLPQDRKDAIMFLFQEQRAKFAKDKTDRGIIEAQTPAEHWEAWLDEYREGVNNNNEGRELLYGSYIQHSNQFAQENTEFEVPADDQGALNPKASTIISETSWSTGLIEIIRQEFENDHSKDRLRVQKDLIKALDGKHYKTAQEVLNEWFTQAPVMEDVLDVVFAALQSRGTDEQVEQLRKLINTIRPMMTWTDKDGNQRDVYLLPGLPEDMGKDDGRYYPNSGATKIRTDATDPFGAILHEAVHAANVKQLETMDESSDEFKQLLEEAKQFARDNLKAPEGSPELKTALSIDAISRQHFPTDYAGTREEFFASKPVRVISEYTAHLNTEMTWTDGNFTFHFHDKNAVSTAAKALTASLKPKPGETRVYYSSSEDIERDLFADKTEHQLTRASMLEVFEILRTTENTKVDDETQQLFQHIITEFIAPGLDSIDSLIVKIAESPTAMRNIGELLRDGGDSVIHLQTTANNFYTSNVDMSLQEVAIHEIAHAIFEHALGIDKDNPGRVKIMNDVERLFDLTLSGIREKIDPQTGEAYGEDNAWKVFLPNPTTYTPVDEQMAQERYSHIFESDGYTEFMAIGVSNPQFLRILQGLDNTPPKALFRGKLVDFLFALFRRALHLLKGEIFVAHPDNINKALTRVVGDIIASNNKERERALKQLDRGPVQDRINGLNQRAIFKLAGLTQGKMRELAKEMSKTGRELDQEFKDLDAAATTLLDKIKAPPIKIAKGLTSAAAGFVYTNDIAKFREAYEAAITKQDHMLAEMVTEILPIAERNRNWIDFLLKSEQLVDQRRQQQYEHTRKILQSFFEGFPSFTVEQREAITQVFLKTDLSSLLEGDLAMSHRRILDMVSNPRALRQQIQVLEAELERKASTRYVTMFNKQSKGLANLMTTAKDIEWMQLTNVENIVEQLNLPKMFQRRMRHHGDLVNILDHLTTLRALQNLSVLSSDAVEMVSSIMEREFNRDEIDNGFTGLLGISQSFKAEAREKLFRNNPTQMWKGYIYEIFDEEVHIEARPYTNEKELDVLIAEMAKEKYVFIETLPKDSLDRNPVDLALFKTNRGIATYSKSGLSLTGEQKRGMGMFETMFTGASGEAKRVTAARTHAMLAQYKAGAYAKAEAQFRGADTVKGVKMLPVFDENKDIVDFRYIMSEENKKKHLKKRDYFDEVLPRMVASVEDRINSKTINEEGIQALYKEWVNRNTDPAAAVPRFVEVGRHASTEEGKVMWNLLPKATQIAVQEIWGSELFYVRDDAVNLVLGFRKMSFANNKFLSKHAPVVRIAEKIWQEIIQWERFRIAVLNPVVVTGNMISNIALLLMHKVPANYIIREAQTAILGMRKYQKQVRRRNELEIIVRKRQALGQNSRHLEAELARMVQAIAVNPVNDLVQEGLFTSIVEEFGMDENSTRRKLTTKLLDKTGQITGSKTAVKIFQEMFMVPGSESGQAALVATQYGDFIGRFVKFNWDLKVKKMPRRQAIHEALDTFIYYNIPQNRVLQAMNDNGFLMFTKFFFRIQPIIARMFTQSPVRSTIVFGMQGMLQSNAAQENIANYAFLHNFTGKFRLTPWEHLTNGDIFMPMSLKWLDMFYPD